jgi:hypothetical protein
MPVNNAPPQATLTDAATEVEAYNDDPEFPTPISVQGPQAPSPQSSRHRAASIPIPRPAHSGVSPPVGDVVSHIRHVSASTTPLAEFLHDPVINESLARRRSRSRSSSKRRNHSKDCQHGSSSGSMMSAILIEQERQALHLKDVISTTGDRLEQEMARAEQASMRAEFAELRLRNVQGQLSAEQGARVHAETEERRCREDGDRLKARVYELERELRWVREQARISEEDMQEATAETERFRSKVHKLELLHRERQAAEEGRETGRAQAKQKMVAAARRAGWEAGFDKGRIQGRDEGYAQGRRDGKEEEREYALVAFDRFLDGEFGPHGEGQDTDSVRTQRAERTRRWAEISQSVHSFQQ